MRRRKQYVSARQYRRRFESGAPYLPLAKLAKLQDCFVTWTDSEILATLESIGAQSLAKDVTALAAYVGDGEYLSVWVTDSSRPYFDDTTFARIF